MPGTRGVRTVSISFIRFRLYTKIQDTECYSISNQIKGLVEKRYTKLILQTPDLSA
jgi:hypothetical protein